MIEVKLSDIINAAPALWRIGEAKLPAKAAWRTSRLMAKLFAEAKHYEKVRLERFKLLGATTDGGQNYTVPAEKMPELNKQLAAILDETVKIDYEALPLSLFANVELAPADLAAAEKFFIDDTPEPAKE